MNHKTTYILFSLLIIVTFSSATMVFAQVDWSSDYVFVYNDGSQLKLAEGVTATFTESANTGATVIFTDLAVNDAAPLDTEITLEALNVTINSFDPAGDIDLTVEGTGSITFDIPDLPVSVYLDGVSYSRWTSAWSYNNGKITINSATNTILLQLPANAQEAEQIKSYNSFIANIFLAITILGIVPIVLVLWLFRKGTVDGKAFAAAVFIIIILVILVLVALLFMANMPADYTTVT
jgi:hypothetical protein